jgi:hypothetical protein
VLDAYATRPENPAHSGMDVFNDPDGTGPGRDPMLTGKYLLA